MLTLSRTLYYDGELSSPGGEIGRHARFRFWYRKVCRFESYPGHITEHFVRNDKMFGFFMPK